MNNTIVIIYKEVGKDPIFRKVENSIKSFETILGGEIEVIPYDDIVIICRKNRDSLKANIYINNIGFSIRGNIILVKKVDDKFVSLNREQAIKYGVFITQQSFNYKHFDENGKYLTNKELKRRYREKKIKENENKEKTQSVQNDTKPKDNEMSKDEVIQAIANIPGVTVVKQENPNTTSDDEDFNTNETLKLILEIQCSILAFIRKLKENNNL